MKQIILLLGLTIIEALLLSCSPEKGNEIVPYQAPPPVVESPPENLSPGNGYQPRSIISINVKCDANVPCPEGFECWNIPNKGLTCVRADLNLCEVFCNMRNCAALKSYPPQLICNNN